MNMLVGSGQQGVDESKVETLDSAWKSLYRVGGVAALILVLSGPVISHPEQRVN